MGHFGATELNQIIGWTLLAPLLGQFRSRKQLAVQRLGEFDLVQEAGRRDEHRMRRPCTIEVALEGDGPPIGECDDQVVA